MPTPDVAAFPNSTNRTNGTNSASGVNGAVDSRERPARDDVEGSIDDSHANGAATARGTTPVETPTWFAVLERFARDVSGSAGALVEVYADRARVSMRRYVLRVAVAIAVGVVVVVWVASATSSVMRGLSGGFSELVGGRAWLGEGIAGVVALGLAAAAIGLYVRTSARSERTRLKAKYERIHAKRDERAPSSTPSGDDRGTARP